MSRIGKTPIEILKEITVTIVDNTVIVKGPKGELSFIVPVGISVEKNDTVLNVKNTNSGKAADALYGYVRAQIANNIIGVSKGWDKILELSGVGYRAAIEGVTLVLTVGFSHPVKIEPPSGITFTVKEGKIIVSGINKQAVGQIASTIRSVKKPEPYKGKGIKYLGEHIRKKAGKAAKAVGGASAA
jgi:large subunit ribosomal protein L6